MKLGLHLPQFGATPQEITHVARRAESAGYSSIWVSDHIVVPASGDSLPAIEILEPIATLAYVAATTTTIRLATSVIVVPYRNAIHLAKELATLDRLAGGRLVAGVASGWLEAEFRSLRAPYENRGKYTDEAIRLMRACWASDTPEFKGEFFELSGMRFGPRPAARKIPILVGGISRRAIRRAVELGDGWHGSRMKPAQVDERLRWLREIAARRGRSLSGFALSHRVYIGFAERWTETGGYVEGILAPPVELADYLNQFSELGIQEVLITPIGAERTLDGFLDRFDKEVRPGCNSAALRFVMMRRDFPLLAKDSLGEISARLLDSLDKAAGPHEFDAQDAEAQQDNQPPGTRRNDHYSSQQQDRESYNRYYDSPGLPECFYPHPG
jgi:probable F420-dependent oxidoreductase